MHTIVWLRTLSSLLGYEIEFLVVSHFVGLPITSVSSILKCRFSIRILFVFIKLRT